MKKFWHNSTTTISMMLLTVSAFAQQKKRIYRKAGCGVCN